MNHFSTHHRHENSNVLNLFFRGGQIVSVQDEKIGKLTLFEGAPTRPLSNIIGAQVVPILQCHFPADSLMLRIDFPVLPFSLIIQ